MYNFLLRPGYGSQKLLIEFSIENDDEIYIEVLLNAISTITPNADFPVFNNRNKKAKEINP